MERKDSEESKWPTALWVGVGLTVLWFVILTVYAVQLEAKSSTTAPAAEELVSHWHKFWHSSPDTFGNALAGVFAPLAFLWLVVTVLLQSRELALQRDELQSTRMELKRSAVQQEAQSGILQAQAARQEQIFLQSHFEDRYRSLLLSFYTIGFETLNWKLGPSPGSGMATYHFLFETGDEITETYLARLLDEPIHSSSMWLLRKLSHCIHMLESASFQLLDASNAQDVEALMTNFLERAVQLHKLAEDDISGVINIKLKRSRLVEITRAVERIISRL